MRYMQSIIMFITLVTYSFQTPNIYTQITQIPNKSYHIYNSVDIKPIHLSNITLIIKLCALLSW